MTTAMDIRTGARLTLEEFFELPDMEQRAELHGGILYLMPEPSIDHQFLTQLLWKFLFDQLAAFGLAHAYVPVNLVPLPEVSVAPDIVVIRAGREDIIRPVRVDGAPDIVVEVLSSNRNIDLVRKREWYAAAGIPEYWILDGDTDTLLQPELGDDGTYRERGTLTAADTLTTPLFPQFSLPLAQLFEHPSRIRR